MNKSIICFIFIAILSTQTIVAASANVLIKPSNDQDNESIAVMLNRPDNLNFLSKTDILNKREKYLQLSPNLLQDAYRPDPSVFEHMENGKVWWGMQGAFIWGAGKRSIEGPAEESRFILNPLLLVGANPHTALMWKTNSITDNDLADPNFPLCWLPSSLTYFPGLSLAQVTYPVSEFNQQIKIRQDKLRFNPASLKINGFGLIAYNARDFGFQYMYLDISKSINVINANGCKEAIAIKQLIHCGNSCKYPGGCNNMSPAMPAIDHFILTNLPARACVYLWKNKPSSIADKADFTFYLDFR